MNSIFCNNCAETGHTFRDCSHPVLSCGIILVRNRACPTQPTTLPIPVNNIELLMVRRKDSMAYTDFMRGKYNPTDTAYVQSLLSTMTQSELKNIRTQTFETLWARMSLFSDRNEYMFQSSREKFYEVLPICQTATSPYTEPEWGFPKGRRFRSETDIQCAAREFFEETNIIGCAYTLIEDAKFSETFVGTNQIPYEHRYILATVNDPTMIDLHQRFTLLQKREISAIAWKTLSDCAALTRPHYSGRTALLSECKKVITGETFPTTA